MGIPQDQRRSRYEVPPLLARVCPELTLGKYTTERANPLFLYQRVLVSEESFLEFSALTIPGIRPNPGAMLKQPTGMKGSASAPVLPSLPPRGASGT